MIPLFKKGDIQFFGNYRPISLLSSVLKVFEKTAYGQLYEYLSSHALFNDSQYGFRKYHSTELAALELVDRIHKEIDENKIPFSVFLDLSKAFDTLEHDILLHKLQYDGISGTALDWFRSYLTERYQYVDYNGVSSSMKLLTTGVSQGSILGPLLFISYMNDIHTVSNNFNFILYADDTTTPLCSFTYGGYHDINRVSTLINSLITKISEWLSVNKLSLNANKTKLMTFHNYQKVMTDSDIPQLEINNTPIERVTEFNFLGITINEFMNWGSHSVKIANKICRTLGVMNCLKIYLPLSALKIMYDSFILYHIQLWITCLGFEWGRLAKLQKRAVRIITNSKYNAHTEPLFKDLNLLKITDIFEVQCVKFWYKFSNNTLQNYLRSMFQYNSSLYETETRNHDRMHVFPTRTFGGRNVLRHRLPELVYQLPADLIRKAKTHSITALSNHIKHHILESYSYAYIELNCYVCNNIAS